MVLAVITAMVLVPPLPKPETLQGYLPLGPYSRPMPRALRWSLGGGGVLMSGVYTPPPLKEAAEEAQKEVLTAQDTNTRLLGPQP
jgi:hypothetical protein